MGIGRGNTAAGARNVDGKPRRRQPRNRAGVAPAASADNLLFGGGRCRSSNQEQAMSENVYKIVELTGSSTKGSDDAIRVAIARASQTLKHLDWFQVVESRGHIADGRIEHWQVTLKVGFRIEGS
jgi:flavin-binding protein dodecin